MYDDDSHINVDISSDTILAATEDDVILRARFANAGTDEECVAVVARKIYFEAMTTLLDRKADYFRNWKEYCGVPWIMSDDYTELGNATLLSYDRIEAQEKAGQEPDYACIHVTKYRLNALHVEMEHG